MKSKKYFRHYLKKETRNKIGCSPSPFVKLYTVYIKVFAIFLNVHIFSPIIQIKLEYIFIILPLYTHHLNYIKNTRLCNEYLTKICSCKIMQTIQDIVKLKQAKILSSLIFCRQCPSFFVLFVLISF